MASVVGEFLGGVGLLARGLRLVVQRPRLFRLGALPPLIMSVIFTGLLIVLITQLPALAAAITPFADGWASGVTDSFRVLVAIALLGGTLLIMVISFTTLTLALGSPIYDQISEAVDRELEPELRLPQERLITSVGRAVRQSVVVIAISLLVAPPIFLIGLIPVVGQVLGPVLSAIFGAWMLSIELIGSTFERRGLVLLADRRSAMRARRARVLGFGVPVFLLSAIPFAGVIVFPAATAGATLLARDLLNGRALVGPRS